MQINSNLFPKIEEETSGAPVPEDTSDSSSEIAEDISEIIDIPRIDNQIILMPEVVEEIISESYLEEEYSSEVIVEDAVLFHRLESIDNSLQALVTFFYVLFIVIALGLGAKLLNMFFQNV